MSRISFIEFDFGGRTANRSTSATTDTSEVERLLVGGDANCEGPSDYDDAFLALVSHDIDDDIVAYRNVIREAAGM